MTSYLTQNDFKNGSYRIKEPGNYILKENIVFNPTNNNLRSDMPKMGWFCIISIECDHVNLNLNYYNVEFDPRFIEDNIKKYGNYLLTIISLNNAAMLDTTMNYYFGYQDNICYNMFNYPIDYDLHSANYVNIQNGRLHKSSRYIINGFYNKFIELDNLEIFDFEVSAIHLLGSSNINIKNCDITGLCNKYFSKPDLSRLATIKIILQNIRFKKVSLLNNKNYADEYLKIVEDLINKHYEKNLDKQTYIPYNVIPIHIGALPILDKNNNTRGLPTVPFNLSSLDITNINNITIKNVNIHDINIHTKTIETIRDSDYNLLMISDNIGIIKWKDIIPNKKFYPNIISKIITYCILCLYNKKLTKSSIDILKSIFYRNEIKFNKLKIKEQASLIDGTFPHGSYGIRIDYATNVIIKNICIYDIKNIGRSPCLYKENDKNNRYQGNDVTGIGFNSTLLKDVIMNNVRIKNIFSSNGYVNSTQIAYDDKIKNTELIKNFLGGVMLNYNKTFTNIDDIQKILDKF